MVNHHAMNFKDALGSASIVGHKDRAGRWKMQWHARLRFPGGRMAEQMPGIKVRDCMLSLAVPICGRCLAALDMGEDERAAALGACKRADCRRLADRRANDILRAWTEEAYRDLANPPEVKAEEVQAVEREAGATVAQLLDAWAADWPKAMDSTAEKEARRQATSLMRVLAFAEECWTVKEQGDGRRGVKVGERQADMCRLGRMTLEEVLTEEGAQRYFERACAAAGVPCSWAPSNARLEYVTINRTMEQARGCFTKLARAFIYKGRVEIPAGFMEWKSFQLLPLPPRAPEPVIGAEFDAMVAAREAMREAEPGLYLVNKVLVQTGIRSGSVKDLRGDWARVVNGQWILHVKVTKANTREYSVPITEELGREIQAAGAGYCFGKDEAARHDLVCCRHNAWLKLFVADPRRGSQGNHRLRKTLASAVLALKGIEVARRVLGHADKAVTEASYAAVGVDVTEIMRREFRAFL